MPARGELAVALPDNTADSEHAIRAAITVSAGSAVFRGALDHEF
jgi:hypothetical protein